MDQFMLRSMSFDDNGKNVLCILLNGNFKVRGQRKSTTLLDYKVSSKLLTVFISLRSDLPSTKYYTNNITQTSKGFGTPRYMIVFCETSYIGFRLLGNKAF